MSDRDSFRVTQHWLKIFLVTMGFLGVKVSYPEVFEVLKDRGVIKKIRRTFAPPELKMHLAKIDIHADSARALQAVVNEFLDRYPGEVLSRHWLYDLRRRLEVVDDPARLLTRVIGSLSSLEEAFDPLT